MNSRREFLIGSAVMAFARPVVAQTRFKTLNDILAKSQTTSVLVLENGSTVFTYGDIKEISYLASARKSLISMLYGPSVERGKIRLNLTLKQMGFDDMGGLLPVERTATIRDLLTARSGIYHPAANLGDATDRAPVRGSVKPGSYFLYNNWDFNALGDIFEKLTGRGFYRAFYEDIGGPIGFEDWREDLQAVRNDTNKSTHPARHFVLSTRDMARVGQLMLDGGKWKGKKVLSSDWVKRTTSLVTSAAEVSRTSPFVAGLGYGYLWWILDRAANWPTALKGAYTASGAFGQFITVIPSQRMVIAHKTAVPPDRNVPAEDYLSRILPAALSSVS